VKQQSFDAFWRHVDRVGWPTDAEAAAHGFPSRAEALKRAAAEAKVERPARQPPAGPGDAAYWKRVHAERAAARASDDEAVRRALEAGARVMADRRAAEAVADREQQARRVTVTEPADDLAALRREYQTRQALRAAQMRERCSKTKVGDLDLETCGPDEAGRYELVARDATEQAVGKVSLYRGDRRDLVISYIVVNPEARTKRLGTSLYERALRLACKEKRVLASDETRSPFAEAFWRKQQKKNRAICEGKGGEVYGTPIRILRRSVLEGKLTQEAFDAILAKLPDPEGSYWPCGRYYIPNPCKTRSLKGLPRGKRRR